MRWHTWRRLIRTALLLAGVLGLATGAAAQAPAPQITSVTPNTVAEGDTNVALTIAGNNFQSGAQVSFSDTGITVNSVTFVSAAQLDITISVALITSTGPRDVTVTNPDSQAATLIGGLTVNPAVPQVSMVTPPSVPQGPSNTSYGGLSCGDFVTEVTLTGSNFKPGAVVLFSGTGIVGPPPFFSTIQVFVDSPTQIRARFIVTGAATPGPRDITVRNINGGESTLAGGLTVGAPLPDPIITSITPNQAAPGDIVMGTIAGSNFQNVKKFWLGDENSRFVATDYTVLSTAPSAVQVSITLDAAGPPGSYELAVCNENGAVAVLPNAFTVLASAPPPTVTSVIQSSVLAGRQDFRLQVLGTDFVPGATVTFSQPGITVNSVQFNLSTQLDVRISVSRFAVGGLSDVIVTNPGGLSGTGVGLFNIIPAPPLIITPSPAQVGQPVTVSWNNNGFGSDIEAIDFGDGTINVDIFSPQSHTYTTPGTYTLQLFHEAGSGFQSLISTAMLTVSSGAPPPQVTSIMPATATAGSTGVLITILGADFQSGAQVSFSGAGITVTGVTFAGASQLTASLDITAGAAPGLRDLTVTNPDGQSATAAGLFNVVSSAPTITSLSQTVGYRFFQVGVDIFGANFQNGSTVTLSGTGANPAGPVLFFDSGHLLVPILIDGTAPKGPRDITVTDSSGNSATCSGCFTIMGTTPVINQLVPNQIVETQVNVPMQILGDDFIAGLTVGLVRNSQIGAVTTTIINLTVNQPGDFTPGVYDVTICNPQNLYPFGVGVLVASSTVLCSTATGAFTVTAPSVPPPQVTSIMPATATAGSTALPVTIVGSNFQSGAQVSFSGSGITVTGVTFVGAGQLTASLDIGTGAATGPRDLIVTNPDGQSATLTGAFTVSPPPAPVVTSIAPTQIREDQRNILLRITGMNFIVGVQVGLIGTQVSYFSSPSELTITPAAIDFLFPNSGPLFTGTYDVQVCVAGGCGTLPGGLTVTAVPPLVNSVAPGSAAQGAAGTTVTVMGSGFQPGAQVSFSGAGITLAGTTFVSSSQLMVVLSVAAAATTGPRDITVTNPDGQSGTLPGAFVVQASGGAAQLAVSVQPPVVPVTASQFTDADITYTLTELSGAGIDLTSPNGEFISSSGSLLATSGAPLSVAVRPTAQVTETLRIPQAVIAAAQKENPFFTFRRVFSGPAGEQVVAVLNLQITSEALAQFSISQMELRFHNDQGVITVPRDAPVRAYAMLTYTGSGLLQGQWMVDGQPLGIVTQVLTFGQTVRIDMPEIPPVPTFAPGEHRLTLQVQAPRLGFAPPEITYFVEATSPFQPSIVLVGPDEGASLPVAGLNFQWQAVTGRAGIARFRLEVFPERDRTGAAPVLTADTLTESYLLQAAMSSGLVPGTRYRWSVTALDPAGRVVATSQVRSLQVISAAGTTIQIQAFDILSGSTLLGTSSNAEVRVPTGVEVTLNATVLNTGIAPVLGLSVVFKADGQPLDIKTLSSLAPNSPVQLSTLWTPPAWQTYQVSVEVTAPTSRTTLATTARAGLLAVQPGTTAANTQNQQGPLAQQSRTLVVEAGNLPARLHMAGFTIEVANYDPQATPANLTGNGTVAFKNDAARNRIPVAFQGLKADIATGNVSEGRVLEQYSQPIALQMKGYALDLKTFSLAVNYAASGVQSVMSLAAPRRITGASAVFALNLPSYLNTPPVTFAATLEPGGDFLRVLTPSETPALALPSPATGLQITQAGQLVADFSSTSDYTTPAGQTVPADGLLFLTGGLGEFAADTFFATVQPAKLRVSFDLLPLPQQQSQFSGTLRIVDSDLVQPVLPGGYKLRFTAGEIMAASGRLTPGPQGLDGTVQLPPSVSSGGGLPVVGTFRKLAPASGYLKATDVTLGQVEWGAGTPFRLMQAGGELTLPYNAPPSTTGRLALSSLLLSNPSLDCGVRLTAGYLQSPFEVTGSGTSFASDTVSLRVTAAGVTGTIQGAPLLQSRLAEPEPVLLASADLLGLQLPAQQLQTPPGGRTRTLLPAPREGKIGDFAVKIGSFQITFTDSAVTSSSIDGALSIPKPAGLDLQFTGATLTSTAQLVGPKLVAPAALHLAYWRARVELPAQTSALQPAAPVLFASGDPQNTRLPSQQIGGLTKGSISPMPMQILTLAQSYLAIWGGTLKFTVDPQYGAEELDGFPVTEIKIGADGQIQSATLGTNSKFLGMSFALDSAQSLTFAAYNGVDAVGTQPLVTMAGTLSFPTFGSRHMEVQHTAMGAEAKNITPALVQTPGNPDLLHAQASILYVNGFAKGKAFKEFLGLGQLSALKTIFLSGLMTIGKDAQGVYERMGLGIGVDGMKAASLYQAGVISVATKLGTGAVSMATGGEGHAAEVGVLVGDIGEMMAQRNPDTTLLIKTIGDALNLAKSIHKDTDGKEGDDLYTALDLGSASLSVAGTFADKKSDGRAKLLAVLRGLDAAIPILQRADAIKQSPETVNVLRFLRLGLTAAVLYAEDDSFSTKDWLKMSKELFVAAEPLSQDGTYKLSMKIMQGIFAVLENESSVDDAVLAKIASAILAAVNQSGMITHPDARNVMVITQGLLEGVAGAKGMPSPDNFLFIATKVLDVASGGDVNYGDENVKKFLRLGMRTLQAAAITGGGIPYDTAGRMVGDTLATANPTLSTGANETPLEKVAALVALWNSLKSKPVGQALTDAEALLECTGAGTSSGCSGTITDLMQSAAQEVNQATTPETLIYALGRIVALKRKAKLQGAQQEFETALTAHKSTIENSARTQMQSVLNQLFAAHQDDTAQWMALSMGIERQMVLLDDAWPCFDTVPTSLSVNCSLGIIASPTVTVTDPATGRALTLLDVMGAKRLTILQSIRSQLQAVLASVPRSPTSGIDLSSANGPIVRFLGMERQTQLLGASECPEAGETPAEPLTATQQQSCQVLGQIYTAIDSLRIAQADLAMRGIQAALVPREGSDWMRVYLGTLRQFQLLGFGGDASSYDFVSSDYDKLLREGIARVLRASDVDEMRRQIRWNFGYDSPQCTANSPTALRQLLILGAIEEVPPSVDCYNQPAASQRNATLEGVYTAVLASVQQGATLDNLNEGGWLWELFSDSYLPAIFGYNASEAQQRQVTLINAMNASRAAAQAQLLASLQSAPGSELDTLQKRYLRFGGNSDSLKAAARGWTSSWISQAKQASCAGAENWDQRLSWINGFQDDPWGFGGKNDVHKAMEEIAGRCAGFTAPAESTAAYLKAVEEGSATAATKIQELRNRLLRGDSEEDLRAELAWLIAGAVKSMSAPFVNGQTEGERALSQVHRQTDYVLKYRQGSRLDRIVAALKLISEVVRDFNPKAKIPGDLAEKLARTLENFAQSGPSSQGPAQAALQFAVSLINEFVPEGGAKKFLLGTYMGLLRETPSEQAALVYIPVGVMGGLALAIGDKIVMQPGGKEVNYAATLDNLGLEGEFWNAAGSKYIPGSVKLVSSIIAVTQLYSDLRKNPAPTVPDQVPKPITDLIESVANLVPAAGKYLSALIQPENKLLAPDTPQSHYIANVLLAELGLGRQEFPQPLRAVQFKSTCPTFDFRNGVQGLPATGQEAAVCAIDLAREAVRGALMAAIDPNSPAAINQQSQQQITQMQQDAIFAPAIGDANLSGISGGMEYRNGQFNKFELFVTVKAMVFENAASVTYDAGQQILTFQQASADPRDPGLLVKFGLTPNSNMLLGSNVFGTPIKSMFFQVRGGNVNCAQGAYNISGRMSLGFDTPIGAGWSTGEQGLALCFDPFGFLLDSNLNASFGVLAARNNIRLFYGNGNGGLNLRSVIGPEVGPLFGWGAYANVDMGAGLTAGVNGLHVQGSAAGGLGLFEMKKQTEACNGSFVLSDPGKGEGQCRYGASVNLGFIAGSQDFSGFYLKTQGGVDMWFAYLGVWTYTSNSQSAWGGGRFPNDQFGGWTRNFDVAPQPLLSQPGRVGERWVFRPRTELAGGDQ